MSRAALKGFCLLACLAAALLSGCSTVSPPRQPLNLCAVFSEKDDWRKPATRTESRWGIPVSVLMATMFHESSYKADARPPRRYYLGFIPGGRLSTAYGYAQAKDEVWQEYVDQQNRWFASRADFDDAIDFIGWYHNGSVQALRVSPGDMRSLYLAYNEGRGGFSRSSYRGKTRLLDYTEQRVIATEQNYRQQLASCPLNR